MKHSQIVEKLNWRYAVKSFDSAKKLSDEQLNFVLESLRLSPSSFGLQPWNFVVVRNTALRQELLQHSWGQKQVIEASHLLVLCSLVDMTTDDVERFVADTVQTRGVPADSLQGYKKMMLGFLAKFDQAKKQAWMRDQVYIALGNAMTACALADIDACPMEGFDSAAYDRILGLTQKGLKSVVVLPIGYRSADDKYAAAKKVRYPLKDLVTYID